MPDSEITWYQHTNPEIGEGLDIPEIIGAVEEATDFHHLVAHMVYTKKEDGTPMWQTQLYFQGGPHIRLRELGNLESTMRMIEKDYREYGERMEVSDQVRSMKLPEAGANIVTQLTRHKAIDRRDRL